MLARPYLLFLGDAPDSLAAKVAFGIRDWRPDAVVGQLRLPGCQTDLGLADRSIAEAAEDGARTLVIGVANRGGIISQAWRSVLLDALDAGLDIASGLHNRLTDDPELVARAQSRGRQLIDVRVPRMSYPIADGRPRSGKRCLAVGTDCSVGKMYTGLALEREMQGRGLAADFRATGQTGILITGQGVPLDAVVADFMAGAVEWLSPNQDQNHWDLIEGQGSLFHPSYSGVTLALIHGGQPDALVLCHEPSRPHLRGLPDYPVPRLEDLRDLSLKLSRWVNKKCQVIGISINTSAFSESAAQQYLSEVESRMHLPTVDPFRHGVARLVDRLLETGG